MSTIEKQKDALVRLLKIAQRDSGQAQHVACFLLALYNEYRFKFNLRDFRLLDAAIFADCVEVMNLDWRAHRAIEAYIKDGDKVFEQLAIYWDVHDYSKGARS